MELEIQKYLRNGGTLDGLRGDPYNLNVREVDGLVGFKYNTIRSNMVEEICQEARGLILDPARNWKVMSYPFKKFFNSGESKAATLDWETATVMEKLDGSMACVYYDDRPGFERWTMHTTGSVNAMYAPLSCDGFVYPDEFRGTSFGELFWHTVEMLHGKNYFNSLNKSLNFIFELITPYNRIVTKYDTYRLPLIGARDRSTLLEVDIHANETWSNTFDVVRTFPFKTLVHMTAGLDFLRPDEEGFVACDAAFNRVKLKQESYTDSHHTKDGIMSRKNGILSMIIEGTDDDFVALFPEYGDGITETKTKLTSMVNVLALMYDTWGGLSVDPTDKEARKTFALNVQQYAPKPLQGAFFMALSKKMPFDEALFALDVSNVAAGLDMMANGTLGG